MWTQNLIKRLLELSRQAGQAVMDLYKTVDSRENHVIKKADNSPLTLADICSHEIIVQGLKCLTPEIPIVSEEDPNSLKYRLPTGEYWLIDPLDGTKEFLLKNDEFTINLAFIRNGLAIFGIVFAPALNTLYWGGAELGAFRASGGNKTQIRIAKFQAYTSLRILISRSHLNTETLNFIKLFEQPELISVGSSLKFCRIAEGNGDIYPRLGPTCEWDTAAGQAILEAAQGYVWTLTGQALCYGKSEVVNPPFIATSTLELMKFSF